MDVKAMRAREQAATEGPWENVNGQLAYPTKDLNFHLNRLTGRGEQKGQMDADRDFIAHARQDIPDLLDTLDEVVRLLKDHHDSAGWLIWKEDFLVKMKGVSSE